MKHFLAIGLGEILWDVLPDTRLLGGAPANFAYQVNALGGAGVPVSRLGDDALGREALSILVAKGVIVDAVAVDPEHPTGTVDALVDDKGVATYVFPDDVAWDFMGMDDLALSLAAKADAVCFGTLAQRSATSRSAVQTFLDAAQGALKVYDINLRQHFYSREIIESSLGLADVLKINDDELSLVAEMFALPADEQDALAALRETYDLRLAVLTRGEKGSLLLSREGVSDLPGQPTRVVDTIGAGDAFTAALVLGYLSGWSLDAINRRATDVAAFVCGQPGAMPEMPENLRIL
ncbi:carbohydrate kinase family protein [Pseudodesulfovibrio sediminis]|uniref:Fructokinase n=1 Tax=Pseudodesulfovibrio sediminis TaxID=2810563 RepID=A0ABN6ETD0_9BACT|nr:carbohydrate kinase [Pseudodesulfovibrio sediminis]BCS88713.1 fructokinase [Pseudodesulfovibrio sediminis]